MLSAIVCMDKLNVIGVGDKIPWNCPVDRAFFKDFVKDKNKICGRKTWDTIKNYDWAIDIIVISRNSLLYTSKLDGQTVSFHEFIPDITSDYFRPFNQFSNDYVVIGGAQIYEMAAPHVSTLYVTRIDKSTYNPAKAILFPWAAYNKYSWKEEIFKQLDEGVTVYRLTKTTT